eukprot:CAMPEP_0202017338 /NCGR_PEP_ID=MMETSP0905-20130828/36714_1 /ASSEMBLY_ACC=CAM_ASM_000554 /TAXON_ID=420261 /ORGANISM="Thalassiosira antarctica, Strain CCMP982" /LENGTH=964 /DNA_ID=CAMNT_0048577963 /DNA_START=180 /DNA_END=3074 /DNA_ORIENTATION=+
MNDPSSYSPPPPPPPPQQQQHGPYYASSNHVSSSLTSNSRSSATSNSNSNSIGSGNDRSGRSSRRKDPTGGSMTSHHGMTSTTAAAATSDGGSSGRSGSVSYDARPATVARSPYDATRLHQKSSSGVAIPPSGGVWEGAAPSVPSQAAIARQQQRRRPTNYTSSYTPPPSLVAHAARAREAHHNAKNASSVNMGGGNAQQQPITSSSRRMCTSLDRSEEDGDERRRHLKSGKHSQEGGGSESRGESRGLAAVAPIAGDQQNHQQQSSMQQRRSHHEQIQLQQMQQQMQQQQQRSHSLHEQQMPEMNYSRGPQKKLERSRDPAIFRQGQPQQQQQGGSSNSQRSGSATSGGGASGRRASQEQHATANNPPTSSARKEGSSGRRRAGQEQHGSIRNLSSTITRHHENNSSNTYRQQQQRSASRRNSSSSNTSSNNDGDGEAMTEQQRIEEYAGKRALLRLEQELADHSDRQQSGTTGEGNNENQIKSVMDRKKLARVPQVKKSDLIIGEYLGRGNFCDVFEVTWILPEQKRGMHGAAGWSSNRTLSSEEDTLEESMDSLALSCSNDLSLIPTSGEGLVKSGSRRSVSQIRTSSATSVAATKENTLRNSLGRSSGMRNPNVLALKCLRPAVRAQPRKFVIGAEDLAHETAMLACLDHPNIIQLYGRAEGCFSTAFQMRSKNSSNSGSGSPKERGRKGKQMSDEGYFIILDKLMTTLTDRIDEWKDECRAINGLAPPHSSIGAPVQLPPETTLREHLCKRLKVAYCIADALEYLHSRHVVFRDLKPANVGFDCNDCVKMFDFGFATSIAPLLSQPYEGYGPLTETCGTRRYMAPEVALKLGYGKEVDVYSFGMLLWEICALDKPFDLIQSVDEFHDLVVLCGRRPSLNTDPLWTVSLKNLICRCWSTDPLDRPNMGEVKSLLCNVLRDMNKEMEIRNSGNGSGRGGGSTQRQEQGGNFIHKWRRRVSI